MKCSLFAGYSPESQSKLFFCLFRKDEFPGVMFFLHSVAVGNIIKKSQKKRGEELCGDFYWVSSQRY